MFLSIILATYNERNNIIPLYDKINEAINNKIDFEVIYIDDNSSDGTLDKIKFLGKNKENIKYISRQHKTGLSSAQLEGAKIASGDLYLFMDSDMQHNPKYIINMLEVFEDKNCNLVSASRFLNKEKINLNKNRYKLSKIVIKLLNFFFKIKKSDILTGYFLVHKDVLIANNKYFSKKGFKLLLDIIFNSKTKILHVEIPFDFEERIYGRSKLNYEVVIEFFYLIINHYAGNSLPFRYFLYALSGLIGLFIQLTFLFIFFKIYKIDFLLSNFMSIIVAMTFNFFANNFATFFDVKIRKNLYLTKLIKFYLFCTLGIFINYLIFYILYSNLSLVYVSIVFGTFIGSLWNFWMNSKFTWNDY